MRDGVLAVRPLDLRVQVRQPARERVHQPNLKFTVQYGQIIGWIDLNVGVSMGRYLLASVMVNISNLSQTNTTI